MQLLVNSTVLAGIVIYFMSVLVVTVIHKDELIPTGNIWSVAVSLGLGGYVGYLIVTKMFFNYSLFGAVSTIIIVLGFFCSTCCLSFEVIDPKIFKWGILLGGLVMDAGLCCQVLKLNSETSYLILLVTVLTVTCFSLWIEMSFRERAAYRKAGESRCQH